MPTLVREKSISVDHLRFLVGTLGFGCLLELIDSQALELYVKRHGEKLWMLMMMMIYIS